jgi:hypothetical protein
MDLQAFLGDGRVARDEWRGGYPTPPCFLQECDSMGVRWWGSAKDVILKGIARGTEFTEVRGHGRQRLSLRKTKKAGDETNMPDGSRLVTTCQ